MRNKAFTRQCCACRCHKDKSELIRLVAIDGEVVIDVNSNIQGRGVYICKDANCIKIAKKKNIINNYSPLDSSALFSRVDEYGLTSILYPVNFAASLAF